MGCNDYNLHLEGSEGNDSPTPEYNIYLDGVGVNGYSPTIDIVNENTASFQIQTNDINGSELTSPIPKLSYLQGNYVSNTSLTSTLAGYLQIDGSNANNPITINGHTFESLYGGLNTKLTMTGSPAYVEAPILVLRSTNTGKVYYKSSNANNELATIGDIGNGTITLTQGGVTKGTFTTNQSGNATIDLDAGGGSITNPLEIEDTDSNNFISIGVNSGGANILLGNTQGLAFNSYLIGNATAPLELTNGAFGDKIIKLNIDSNTLDVNQDGELTVVGGGGTTYTAGTGIDITNDTISVDNTVAMKTDIPDTTYMVTTNTAQTISGVKTFSSETHHLGVITFDSAMLNPIIRGMSGSSYRNMIYRMGNDSAITVGNSSDTIDLKGSGTRPTYNSNDLALYSDIPTNSTYVDLTSAQTITGKKSFSGAELETNNIITLKGNAIIRGLYNTNSYSTYLVGSSGSLLVGNESHSITLRGNAARPVYRTGGTDYDIALSGDIPTVPATDQTYDDTSANPQSGTAVAEAISTKANIDLDNLSSTGTKAIPLYALPSNGITVISMQAGVAQQVNYSGYFCVACQVRALSGSIATLYVYNYLNSSTASNGSFSVYAETVQAGTWLSLTMPVSAGQYIAFNYTGTMYTVNTVFVKARGEV